jgi:uncharacterized protein YndB with AHSA1/START domain
MSCTDDDRAAERPRPVVEREVVLPAPPDEVWESLPAVFGAGGEIVAEPGGAIRSDGPDGARIGVVEEVEPARHLGFWWVPVDGDDPPSHVEITLDPVESGDGVGTIVRIRESQFDAASVADGLLRGPLARARS